MRKELGMNLRFMVLASGRMVLSFTKIRNIEREA